MSAPPAVGKLVRQFDEHRDRLLAPDYKEARLRQDYLDDFFVALGWDVGNKSGYSESFKEVVIEETMRIDGAARAPDYAFRLGPVTQFLAEAKKPRVNLKDDPEPALQLRRYAWTKELPISVLTDFQELAIYNTRVEVKPSDRARTARLFYWTYDQYEDAWEEIAGLLSKGAVLRGSIEKLVVGKGSRSGTEAPDERFLDDIETWRHALARDLHVRHPELAVRQLNGLVQRTIDRIVFLRICEDRRIETFGRLREAAGGKGVYARLTDLYRDADNRYNSGLFHFRKEKGRAEEPDELTLAISFGDKPLREIIHGLYPPLSPYAFDALSADMLGQIYERFLTKTIVVRGKQVEVVEKREDRKEAGIYYTPTFVVDYIVRQTLGPHFEGKNPKQVQDVRVLDPACGSGSFLIQAYQWLLDWYLECYVASGAQTLAARKNPVVRQVSEGIWRLTTTERKRILLTHIYGVDLDAQAVEVTKLSLLLKVLEKETSETVSAQLKLLHERALPDLGENIKHGNSIIGGDVYRDLEFGLLGEEAGLRLSPFDWSAEFPGAAKAGGFHAIIGNPPYIPIEMMADYERAYYVARHPQLERKFDTSIVFTLAMLKLLHPRGLLGLISSVAWQTGENFGGMRELLFQKYGVREILNLPFDVFKSAYVDTGIFVLSRKPTDSYRIYSFPKKERAPRLDRVPFFEVPISLVSKPDYKVVLNPVAHEIARRADSDEAFTTLGEVTTSTQGLAPSRFTIETAPRPGLSPFLKKGNVYRYRLEVEEVGYTSLAALPSLRRFYGSDPKLLIRRVISRADRLLATYTDQEMVFKKDINPFVLTDPGMDIRFLLGVMSSAVVSYVYVNASTIAAKDDFRQTTLAELRRFPIPRFDPKDSSHATIVRLVDQMLKAQEKLAMAGNVSERAGIERQCASIDRQIDQLVGRLFRVSEEEQAAIAASCAA